MKRKLEIMPLPNIDIPGGNESDDRPRHRSSRETTQRSYSTPTPSRTSAPPADPFFFTPYESPKLANKAEKSDAAQAEGASPQPEVKKVGIVPAKPPVGALLGGFKKK